MSNRKTRSQSKDEYLDTDLTIKPIQPVEIKEKRKYNPVLPSIMRNRGSILLLIGSQNSGKTTIINNLLLSKSFWGGKNSAFDNVYIFCPSVELDDGYRFLRENFECYSEYKAEYLENIKKTQMLFDKKDRPKIMIVIDDGSGLIDRNSTFNHYLTRFRHYNSNIILSIQNFKSLSPIARSNASDVVLMNGIVNDKEMEKIEDEYDGMFKGTLKKMYQKYTAKPYSFLYLKVRKNPPEMYQNFTKKIDWKKFAKKSIDDDINSDSENEDIE
jgi:polynucleotide 5'-kinase involved in rRNA processing